jgi:drug/metabolite transporter (DMT)-like permease
MRALPAAAKGARVAGIALVLLAAIGFSAKAVLIKLAYMHAVDAATLLALRMVFSAPFFLAMAAWSTRSAAPMSRRDWQWIALLGFTGYYLASYLDFLGLLYVTASLERLILFLYPTMVLLLSAWLLKTPIRAHHVVALALSYGGITLVFWQSVTLTGAPRQVALGSSLILVSGLIYSFYLVGAGAIIARLGAVRFTAYAMLIACAACVAQFALTHRWDALRVPGPVYGLALVMAIFSTVLPAWFMSEGLRRVGANQAALIGSIGPVATIVLSYSILDEPISLIQLGGVALVLAGVTLASLRTQASPAS